MEELIIGARKLKVERTTTHTDVVVTAIPYVTDNKQLKGIEFKLKGVAYPFRVLTKDLPALFVGSKVKFTGVMREYKGAQYFSPMDVELVEQSHLSQIVPTGGLFSSKG